MEEARGSPPLSAVSPSVLAQSAAANAAVLYRASSRAPQLGLTVSADGSHPPSPNNSPSTSTVDRAIQPQQSTPHSTNVAESRSAFSFRSQRNKVTPGPIFLPKKGELDAAADSNSSSAASLHERTGSGIRLAGGELSVHSLTVSPRSVKGRTKLPALSSFSTASHLSRPPQQAELIASVAQLPLNALTNVAVAASDFAAVVDPNAAHQTQQSFQHQPAAAVDAITAASQQVANLSAASATAPATVSKLIPSPAHSLPPSCTLSTSIAPSLTSTSDSGVAVSAKFSASTCTTAAGSSPPCAVTAATVRASATTAASPRLHQQSAQDERTTSCGCFTALFASFASKPTKPAPLSTQLIPPNKQPAAAADVKERVWSDHIRYAYELTPPPLMLKRPPVLPRSQSFPALLPSAMLQLSEQANLQQLRRALRRSFSGAVSSRQQRARMPHTLRRRLGQHNSSPGGSVTRSEQQSTTADLLRRMPTALRAYFNLPSDRTAVHSSAQDSPLFTDRAMSTARRCVDVS